MKTLSLILLISTFIFIGCANAHRMNELSLGMTKQQVIEILGPPISTSAKQGIEYLNYRLAEAGDERGVRRLYFIKIVDGKVNSYGRYDLDRIPELKQTIDLNEKK